MNKNYIFLAEGFEEIEALTPVDVFRRAGLDIKMVSITDSLEVRGAHGILVTANVRFSDIDFSDANWLVLPGGLPGAQNLYDFEPLRKVLLDHAAKEKNIAAICASPGVVLGQLGILDGKYATCYPGFEKYFPNAKYRKEPVVSLNHIITGNGPAAALKFSLAIIAAEVGLAAADDISNQMMNGRFDIGQK